MKKLLLPLVAAFAFGTLAMPSPAQAAGSAVSICGKKHHKKRHHGKKKGPKAAPAAPASNI
jgi:hypothetical protein